MNPVQEEIYEELQTSGDSSPRNFYRSAEPMTISFGDHGNLQPDRRDPGKALQSVLDQTYPEYELLIINDGGPEGVEEIVRSFHSPKIRYFRMKENRGHASVLNEGVRRSAGSYIAYLDDDDVYYPGPPGVPHKAIVSSGEKFVYSNTQFVRGESTEGKFNRKKMMYRWNEEHDRDKLILNNYIANLSILHEKSVFSRVGLFSEDLNMVMDKDAG